MLVIGEQEEQGGTVSIRKKTGGDLKNISLDEFIKVLKEAVDSKVVNP
jgi:threonyl-tRNA synthetase